MASFQDRVIGAMKLQASTYAEIEHDVTAIGQAAAVVGAVALARGIALVGSLGITYFVMTIVMAFIAWVVGSAVLWAVGTRVIPGKNTQADLQQVMRVVGFAMAPGLFGILLIIPFLGLLIGLIVAIWQIVALVIAVKQAFEYDDIVKAVIVCLIAWAVMFFAMMLVALVSVGPRLYGS
jgi:hypothetical protein